MSAIQLNFTLRTTPQVKTVHLLGSWDNYHGQLPMSRDPSKAAGAWVGTFRFQPGTLNQGQRYWYYVSVAQFPSARDHTAKVDTVHHGRLPRYARSCKGIHRRTHNSA